jgi:hypothetical protein
MELAREACNNLASRLSGIPGGGTKSGPVAIRKSLPLRLEDWIEGNLFAFARQERWFNAIAYYAIRDPRYQRAEVCWAQCVENGREQSRSAIRRSNNGRTSQFYATAQAAYPRRNAASTRQRKELILRSWPRPSLALLTGKRLHIWPGQH